MVGLRRAVCLALGLLLLIAAGPAPASRAEPSPTLLTDTRFGLSFVNAPGRTSPELRYEKAAGLGARWTRWAFYWYLMEPNQGQLDFSAQDAVVDQDIAHGLQIDAVVMVTPGWAASAGSPLREPPRLDQKGLGRQSSSDPSLIPFGTSPPQHLYEPVFNQDSSINANNYWGWYIYQLVSHFKGRVKTWEMWNEPDLKDGNGFGVFWNGTREDYYQLLKVGYLAARAADPTVTVLFSGLAYWSDPGFFPYVLDLMKNDGSAPANSYYFDVIPWHFYVKPYHLWTYPLWSRQEMNQRGINKRIWVNETNIPVCNDTQVDPDLFCPSLWRGSMEEQAAFMIKAYALGAAAGVETIFIFQLYDDNVGPHEWYGLVRNDNTVRPAYTSYQVAAQYLSSPVSVTRTTQGNLDSVAFFGTPQGKVTVLWNYNTSSTLYSIPAQSQQGILVNKYGITQTVTAQNNSYGIVLPPATYQDPQTGFYDVGSDPMLLVEPSSVSLPSSTVDPLPVFASDRAITVTWRRLDTLPTTVHYDIQYRVGATGDWQNWLTDTTLTGTVFGPAIPTTVTDATTYFFRSRAKDQNGVEPYPDGNGDANTTVPYFVSGMVADNRDSPIGGASVLANGTAFSTTSAVTGSYRLGIYPSGTYGVQASMSGFGIQPAKAIGVGPSLTYDFFLAPATELVQNGGFEDGLLGWDYQGFAVTKSFRHTGAFGAYLSSTATLSQSVDLPSSTSQPTLSLVYRTPATSSPGSLIVTARSAQTTRALTMPLTAEDQWRHRWIDLGGMSGPVSVQLALSGDASTVLWLDEVSVGPGPGSGTVQGRVSSLPGRPDAGSVVVSLNGGGAVSSTSTASDGWFTVTNVTQGYYVVTLAYTGFLTTSRYSIGVISGQTTVLPDASLHPGDLKVDANNRVDLFDLILLGGNWQKAAPTPWSGATTTAAGGASGAAIAGAVTSVQGRTDLSGVRVCLGNFTRSSATENCSGTATTTAADGSYDVNGLASGPVTVTTYLPGYLYAQRSNVMITSGITSTLPNVALLAGDLRIDANNRIDLYDLILLGGSWQKAAPTPW